MAGEREVVVEDDTVVTVEVDPTLLDADDEVIEEGTQAATPAPAPAAKTAADQAADALSKAVKTAEGERRARLAAEARAETATRTANQTAEQLRAAREEAATGELTIIVNGIESATRDEASAKAEFIAAHEAGDAGKMADAQAKQSRAAAALDRLEAAKVSFEANAAKRPAATEQRTAPTDAFETYITTNNFAPKAQQWLRDHPDCAPAWAGGDPAKNAAMMEGHYAALRAGLPVNTDQYFEALEKKIGGDDGGAEPAPRLAPVSQAAKTVAAAATEQARQRPKAPAVAAPPTRDVPDANTGQGTVQTRVKLNPQQQEVALFSYPAKPGEDEGAWKKRAFGTYAQEYVKAKAEGKIGRLTH